MGQRLVIETARFLRTLERCVIAVPQTSVTTPFIGRLPGIFGNDMQRHPGVWPQREVSHLTVNTSQDGISCVTETAAAPVIESSVLFFTVPLTESAIGVTHNFCYDTFFDGLLNRFPGTEMQRQPVRGGAWCRVEVSHLTVCTI